MRKVVFANTNRKKTIAIMHRLNIGLCAVNTKINPGRRGTVTAQRRDLPSVDFVGLCRKAAVGVAVGAVTFGSLFGNDAVYAATNVTPTDSHNNNVVVTDSNYSVNEDTTEHDGSVRLVYGGGDDSNKSGSVRNTITLNDAKVTGAVIGGVAAGGSVRSNRIEINGGSVNGAVGGLIIYTEGSPVAPGDVVGNTVVVNSGIVDYVSGGEIGYAYANSGGSSTPDVTAAALQSGGNVTGNIVQINGGQVTGGIVGGASLTGSATNNTINIAGGTVSGNVVGGQVRYQTTSSSAGSNTINVSGTPDLSGANLIGGMLGSAVDSTNNTLNISNTKNITAQSIAGFSSIDLLMPNDMSNGDTMLTLTSSGTTDLNGVVIAANIMGGDNVSIKQGDTYNLISNSGGTLSLADVSSVKDYMMEGASLKHLLTNSLSADGSSLIATVASEKPIIEEKNRLISSPAVVTPMIISEPKLPDPLGFDYEPAIDIYKEDKAEAKDEKPLAMVIAPFFDFSGMHSREKTGHGSYLDVDSIGLDAGVAFGKNNRYGRLVWAPIVDYGHGKYDTYLSDGSKGKGSSDFWAGGLIARQTWLNGFYVESSLRAGRTEVDFLSNAFENGSADGGPLSFNSSASIMTGHLRIGRLLNLDKRNNLHLYGVYTHTHQGSMDAVASSNDHYRFSSVDNGRFRLGARLTRKLTKTQRLYSGLAYQYALNGDATTTVKDAHELPKVGKDGSSAMIELGWQIKPREELPMALDIGATGWFGMQKGVSITARIKREF